MGRIMVLMDHKENRRLLAEWLATRYTVLPQEMDGAVDEEYDLCILDGTALDRLADRIQDRKKYQQTVFLPFLLVAAEQHAIGPDDPPPGDAAAPQSHHAADLTRAAGTEELGHVAIGHHHSGLYRVDHVQHSSRILVDHLAAARGRPTHISRRSR